MLNKKVFLSDPFYDEKYHRVFDEWYSPLCNYCYFLINDYEAAEDIVQDQFVNLWENWERLQSIDSIKGYLYKSVKNRSINYIKQQLKINKMPIDVDSSELSFNSNLPLASEMLENAELEKIIEKSIENLPTQCRAIFVLKRIDEMSNLEIAQQLNLSVKTVEAQMTIALKRMYKFILENWELVLLFGFFRII